jgi:hypothetical protein
MRKSPAEQASEQYRAALADLRAARDRYVAAHVPMEAADGRPPA